LDIVAHCRAGRGHWQQAMDKAERQWDPAMMALLARLRDNLAEIERAAKDALNGDYSTDKIEED
jgi:hypothetical protein